MFILWYFAVAEMREISQSFEDRGMPGTIGRCFRVISNLQTWKVPSVV